MNVHVTKRGATRKYKKKIKLILANVIVLNVICLFELLLLRVNAYDFIETWIPFDQELFAALLVGFVVSPYCFFFGS